MEIALFFKIYYIRQVAKERHGERTFSLNKYLLSDTFSSDFC